MSKIDEFLEHENEPDYFINKLRDELKHNRRYWLSPTEEQAVSLRNDAFLRRPIEESLFYSCFSLPQDGEKFQR
ncbi:MAG TPA: hypothetical protein PLL13_15070, partial [Prevotella sp.]|nr:hypothetical protein [Prevotella sp.]